MKTTKVAILSPRYELPSPRSIRASNLVKHLIDDFDITVIHFTNEANKNTSGKYGEKLIRLALASLSKYITNKSFSGFKPKGVIRYIIGLLNRICQMFFLFPDEWIVERKKVLRALNQIKPEIIIASMHPFSMGSIAITYKNQAVNNPKVIFDIGDPYSFNAVNKHNSKRKTDFEMGLVSQADHIILTNNETKRQYNESFLVRDSLMTVIPQGIDLETFISVKKDQAPNDQINLVYAGAFYPGLRDPRLFFKSVEEVRPEIKIDVFGNHLELFRVKSEAIKFHGRVDQTELAKHYNVANGLLFFDNKEGIQSSGKIFELLALKKPIIFIYENESSPVYEYCQTYEHILFIKNDISTISRETQKIDSFLKQGFNYDYNIDQFSWQTRAKLFKDVLKKFYE